MGYRKQKKPQKAPLQQSPQKNPTEICQKGKIDKSKQLTEPLDLDEEELCAGIEDNHAEEVEPITWLPKYIPPQKAIAKVLKDLNNEKFMVSTPSLS